MTYTFNTYDEISLFIEFCNANSISVEFDRVNKSATVADEWAAECDHFIEKSL